MKKKWSFVSVNYRSQVLRASVAPGAWSLLNKRKGITNPTNPELASPAQQKIYILMLAFLTDLMRYCLVSCGAWRPRRWVDRFMLGGSQWQQGTAWHFWLQLSCPSPKDISFGFGANTSDTAVWLQLQFLCLTVGWYNFVVHSSSSLTEILKIVGCGHCTSDFLLSLSHPWSQRCVCRGWSAGWKTRVSNCSKTFPAPRDFTFIWETDHGMGSVFVYMTCLWIQPLVSHDFGLSNSFYWVETKAAVEG